jgi:DNA-binding MarR family transcriptional regulator
MYYALVSHFSPTTAPGASDQDRRVADGLLATLAAIRRAGRRYSTRPVELSSLTGAQLELARLVRRRPGSSIASAAEELRLAPNTVSTLVGELTAAGLLLRRVDPRDRRVASLELAPALGRKIDAWRDRRATALGDAIRRLDDGERLRVESALPVLARIADELEAIGTGG